VRSAGAAYTAEVDVEEAGDVTHHRVRFRQGDLDRWGQGRSPEELIRRSFEFLLEHESKESILRDFDLSVIRRYFPDYEQAIVRES